MSRVFVFRGTGEIEFHNYAQYNYEYEFTVRLRTLQKANEISNT